MNKNEMGEMIQRLDRAIEDMRENLRDDKKIYQVNLNDLENLIKKREELINQYYADFRYKIQKSGGEK